MNREKTHKIQFSICGKKIFRQQAESCATSFQSKVKTCKCQAFIISIYAMTLIFFLIKLYLCLSQQEEKIKFIEVIGNISQTYHF